MTRTIPPPLSIVLTYLRLGQGWSQKELAEATGLPPNLISDYERGRKTLSRERLEDIVCALGLRLSMIDTALDFHQVLHASQIPGSSGDQEDWEIESIVAEASRLTADYARSLLNLLIVKSQALEARQLAAAAWRRLKQQTPEGRRILVEELAEFRNWALCERICEESIKAAADNADRALELAELALRIAELNPSEETWRWRLQGYAWAHVGNARRVRGDLPRAEEAFDRAKDLWQAGAPGDLGLLDEARVLGLEASLRRDQRRFPETLELLDRALASDQGREGRYLLLNKANLLLTLGEFGGAIEALRRASPLVEAEGEPQFLFALRFNLAVNLCFLGRYGEVEVLVPELRRLATELGNDLDLVRLRWLEGRIAAGLEKRKEALEILSQVRAEFSSRGIAYDAALVSLDLTLLYLKESRTAEVKTLARQMAPIFQAQGVHREALAALKLFRDAAEREAVTLDLARRLVTYFHRAQHDPGLRFEEA
jgi:transcriptional regulator with XRE-family HTH domain